MNTPFVRSRLRIALSLATAAMLAGCSGGDVVGKQVLSKLPDHATRVQALEVLGTGHLTPYQPGDTARLVSGFRVQRYIAKGIQHEILWYRESEGTVESPITRNTDTPIVFVSDSLRGWGWRFFEKYAAQYDLPNPDHSQARRDSISKSQLPKN